MGMGFGSNFADVIEFAEIKALCPAETKALESTLKKYGVSMAVLAQTFRFEEPELEELQTALWDAAPAEIAAEELDAYEAQGVQEVMRTFANLKAAFRKATTVGKSHLELAVGYHDAAQDGDRYDEVDGVFWAVHGLYQLSPAGKKFGKKVERKFFVTFG